MADIIEDLAGNAGISADLAKKGLGALLTFMGRSPLESEETTMSIKAPRLAVVMRPRGVWGLPAAIPALGNPSVEHRVPPRQPRQSVSGPLRNRFGRCNFARRQDCRLANTT